MDNSIIKQNSSKPTFSTKARYDFESHKAIAESIIKAPEYERTQLVEAFCNYPLPSKNDNKQFSSLIVGIVSSAGALTTLFSSWDSILSPVALIGCGIFSYFSFNKVKKYYSDPRFDDIKTMCESIIQSNLSPTEIRILSEYIDREEIQISSISLDKLSIK